MPPETTLGTFTLEEPSTIVLHIVYAGLEDSPGTIEGCKFTISLDPDAPGGPDLWVYVK
jgi:hypothetical protein